MIFSLFYDEYNLSEMRGNRKTRRFQLSIQSYEELESDTAKVVQVGEKSSE